MVGAKPRAIPSKTPRLSETLGVFSKFAWIRVIRGSLPAPVMVGAKPRAIPSKTPRVSETLGVFSKFAWIRVIRGSNPGARLIFAPTSYKMGALSESLGWHHSAFLVQGGS